MARKSIQSATPSCEVLSPVVLTAHELAGLRHAHDLFVELRSLICEAIVPALGGSHHPINARLYTLLSEVTLHSGNFGYRHWRGANERAADAWTKGREVSHVSR